MSDSSDNKNLLESDSEKELQESPMNEQENETNDRNEEQEEAEVTFKDLGVCDVLCESIAEMKWDKPTPIQRETLRQAFQDRDIIGLAETGSGKTGAFAIPVIQRLIENPQRLFALVLTPTRELAFQIGEQFEALGATIGLKTAVVVGGVDMVQQSIALAKRPHVIIGTPGRLVDHLENTKVQKAAGMLWAQGFNLRTIKFLIMDEADRMLSLDFEEEINKILEVYLYAQEVYRAQVMPRDRHTYLFSATMTKKVAKLQKASLQNPVKVQVSSKYQTVKTLVQQVCSCIKGSMCSICSFLPNTRIAIWPSF